MNRPHGQAGPEHRIGGLFTFSLLGLFALLSLLIVVIGADGYRRVVHRGDAAFQTRTSLGYVAGKLRSPACRDGVMLETADGVTVLSLTEQTEDGPAVTSIYHRDGALYELYYLPEDMAFDPEAGQRLTEVAGFSMAVEGRLVRLTAAAPDGGEQTLCVALRGGQEVTLP